MMSFTPRLPQVYDIDGDGYISNGELFTVLEMLVGNNLDHVQLQQIVDKTIRQYDCDGDGRISYEEFLVAVQSYRDFCKLLKVEDVFAKMVVEVWAVVCEACCMFCLAFVSKPKTEMSANFLSKFLLLKMLLLVWNILYWPKFSNYKVQ